MIESVGKMSEIYELEQIRQRISERYRSDPNIRINCPSGSQGCICAMFR